MRFPTVRTSATPDRVVITGAGIISPLGRGWKQNAEGFRNGTRAFRPVTLFDVSRQRAKTAAEVTVPAELPPTRLSGKQVARLDRGSRMLVEACAQAWGQSGFTESEFTPLVLGTTSGGMALGEEYFKQAIMRPNAHRGQPTRAFYYQAQTQGRVAQDALGLNGSIMVISNACASGGSAIGHAWELIRWGHTTTALAAGYDTISELVFGGFDALQALSPTKCRPFDATRDGLGLGEGAAALVLETLESAKKRGAEILGEVAGYGSSTDHHHLTQPHPEGEAARLSMQIACESARMTPADIDYVNAHGTGTPLNDSAEAMAINRWAGARASTLPVSSTKSAIGHLLGGAGAVEAVACLMALREGWLPPEKDIERPDAACAFPIIQEPREVRMNTALSNSFGFGGVNATLILRRWS